VKRIEPSGHPQPQTRREFCQQACQAASLLALGVAMPACGGGGSPTAPSGTSAPPLPVIAGNLSGNTVTVGIDGSSPLSSVGGAALVQAGNRAVLVSRTAQDAFTALTATCTHEACTVNGFQSSLYVCPCHGSQYSTTGTVVRGPATRGLQQFPAQLSNNVLTISV
jgi:cytochrome b6-f complex iron-sulfur subunit